MCTGYQGCSPRRGLFCSFGLVGVCEILDVSEKCAGQCPACLGSGVDGRLYDLRLCSENLGEKETLELESGRKGGPVAPQAPAGPRRGQWGQGESFLGLDKQTRPFSGRVHGALTSLVSCKSQRKPVPACSPRQGWQIPFLQRTRKETFHRKYCGHRVWGRSRGWSPHGWCGCAWDAQCLEKQTTGRFDPGVGRLLS